MRRSSFGAATIGPSSRFLRYGQEDTTRQEMQTPMMLLVHVMISLFRMNGVFVSVFGLVIRCGVSIPVLGLLGLLVIRSRGAVSVSVIDLLIRGGIAMSVFLCGAWASLPVVLRVLGGSILISFEYGRGKWYFSHDDHIPLWYAL
jgi:hypothetical protein